MYEDGVSSVLIVGHLHLLNVGRSMAALMELPMRMPNEDLIAFRGEGRGSSICPLKRCRRWAINYAMLRWPGGTTRIQDSGFRDPGSQLVFFGGCRTGGHYKLASRLLRHSHICNCIKCANIFSFSSCRFLFNLTILFDLSAVFLRLFQRIRFYIVFYFFVPPLRQQFV